MAEIDFGGWLARKYDIMQQNANTNAAEVEQRNSAAVMQYGVGGVYDRGETAATKRKQMELDQDTYKYDKGFPLQEMDVKSAASERYARARNLDTESNFNEAVLPSYVAGANYDVKELERRDTKSKIDAINRNFVPDIVPNSRVATPRNSYRVDDSLRPTGIRPVDYTLKGAANMVGRIHQLYDFITYKGQYK